MNEEWRPVTLSGYEDAYEVSNLGRVRRSKSGKGTYIGRILKLSLDGYYSVRLYQNNIGNTIDVHRLVAGAFLGYKIGEGMMVHVNHKDFNKLNNHVNNLEVVTAKENLHHTINSGRWHNRGEEVKSTKLKNNQVIDIMSLKDILKPKDIANYYKINISTVYDIWAGRRWFHLFKDNN